MRRKWSFTINSLYLCWKTISCLELRCQLLNWGHQCLVWTTSIYQWSSYSQLQSICQWWWRKFNAICHQLHRLHKCIKLWDYFWWILKSFSFRQRILSWSFSIKFSWRIGYCFRFHYCWKQAFSSTWLEYCLSHSKQQDNCEMGSRIVQWWITFKTLYSKH